ncbi:hypothetical protein MAHJHV57_52020 [Mycobacterium avium subsp. hominissuis]
MTGRRWLWPARRSVTEVLGLQARQRVEVAGPGEGLPRGITIVPSPATMRFA